MTRADLDEIIQLIYDEHGELTPDLLVKVASDPSHPLHARFDWDNVQAGDKWRLEQAHRLIQSVRVVYRKADKDEKPTEIRQYHAVRTQSGFVYRSNEDLKADPKAREMVLRDMEREWLTLKRRYESYQEFWTMVEAATR